MPEAELRTKHLRAAMDEADGTRIYVSRRWPRGIAKGERFSERMPALAPSSELLDAYLDDEETFEEYEERFREELAAEEPQQRLDELAQRVREGETITLLCDHPRDAPDEECHRFIVQAKVEQRL